MLTHPLIPLSARRTQGTAQDLSKFRPACPHRPKPPSKVLTKHGRKQGSITLLRVDCLHANIGQYTSTSPRNAKGTSQTSQTSRTHFPSITEFQALARKGYKHHEDGANPEGPELSCCAPSWCLGATALNSPPSTASYQSSRLSMCFG